MLGPRPGVLELIVSEVLTVTVAAAERRTAVRTTVSALDRGLPRSAPTAREGEVTPSPATVSPSLNLNTEFFSNTGSSAP
uniref:Putative secreted protein n=1 Tax=Ixodes ricinus TaxID=34613 RepID=A0A6B0TVH3_IXORI